MAIPEAAPVPAKPIKCPDPMLLANKEAPTYKMRMVVIFFFHLFNPIGVQIYGTIFIISHYLQHFGIFIFTFIDFSTKQAGFK